MKDHKKIVGYFSDFLKELKSEEFSETTIKNRERHLDQFEKWLVINGLQSSSPNEITEKDIEKYKIFIQNKKSSRTKKKISEQTQKNYLRAVRFFLEFLEKNNIKCPPSKKVRLKERTETDVQKLITYYFKTKGIDPKELKESARNKKIIYSRYTRPAKDLLKLAGSLEKAKKSINTVAQWAKTRDLDYAIETVFKKWPELKSLKPKKKEKKPFYKGDRMVKSRGKWYVIDKQGEWLEFADSEDQITWREVD